MTRPARQGAAGHDVGRGLESGHGNGTGAFGVVRRIGEHVIEAFGVGPQLVELVQPARDVGRNGAHTGLEAVASDVAARQLDQERFTLDQGHTAERHAPRHRQTDDADTGPDIEHPLPAAGAQRGGRRQQQCVDTRPIALVGLQNAQPPTEKGIVRHVSGAGGRLLQTWRSPSSMSAAASRHR